MHANKKVYNVYAMKIEKVCIVQAFETMYTKCLHNMYAFCKHDRKERICE